MKTCPPADNKSLTSLQGLVLGILFFACADGMALSMGVRRGAVTIGRPLDVSIAMLLEAREEISGLCLAADVLYGESRILGSRVRVDSAKSLSAGGEATVRIRTSAVVDEPVVTLVLRAGCLQKTERRYVMLADIAAEGAPAAATAKGGSQSLPGVPRTPEIVGQGTSPVPKSLISRSQRTGNSRIEGNGGSAQEGRISPEQFSVGAPPRRRGNERLPRSTVKSKTAARLTLEPIDLMIEREPTLKSSQQLLSVPTANLQERSAAAALWLALTAQPQDLVRQLEKVQSLEIQVGQLQAENQKNRLAVGELQTKLEQARSERYANELVFALAGLLILALLAIAYAVWRLRRSSSSNPSDIAWWRKKEAAERTWQPDEPGKAVPEISRIRSSKAEKKQEKNLTSLSVQDTPKSSDVRSRSVFSPAKRSRVEAELVPPLLKRDRTEFMSSSDFPSRAVKAEELFDVQQQADFFISIGQHDQAIEVLEHHIRDHVDTSALVYLDLFSLYHQTRRESDYESLRRQFNKRFNAHIPVFDAYNDRGQGLEAYQTALTRIQTLWPSPKVLEVIEESIFRKPDVGADSFDLEAYRELLLLHGIAQELIKQSAASFPFDDVEAPLPVIADSSSKSGGGFATTAIQPLSAAIARDKTRANGSAPPDFSSPPQSTRLGLDIDLSELEQKSQPQADVKPALPFFEPLVTAAPAPHAAAAAEYVERSGDLIAKPAATNLIDFDFFETSDRSDKPNAGKT